MIEGEVTMKEKTPGETKAEMTELVLPNDTNLLGNLLGGRLMHWIDIAGAMAAQRHANRIVVTASIDRVEFRHPVRAGEMITLIARVTWVGRTSMEVAVDVYSENYQTEEKKHTNKAYLTFVAVDNEGKPMPVGGLRLETEEEKREFDAALARRSERLKSRC